MKRLLVICAVAAAAAVLPAAVSATPVQSVLNGHITEGGGWCCGNYATVEGAGTVAGVGRVSFVANWESGCDPWDVPVECFTTETLVLTAKNGDTLTLAGGSDARDDGGLIVTWAGGGTGRFASVSGSGTFSFGIDFPDSTGAVALTGTLSR
jgi:hypothetical protein